MINMTATMTMIKRTGMATEIPIAQPGNAESSCELIPTKKIKI